MRLLLYLHRGLDVLPKYSDFSVYLISLMGHTSVPVSKCESTTRNGEEQQ
jgi:hypothetical protein